MIYSTRPASSKLAPFVKSIWCYADSPKHRVEAVLPRIRPQLLVNLHKTKMSLMSEAGTVLSSAGPVALQGVLTRRFVIDAELKRKICGVEFEPGGLSVFTDREAVHFCDCVTDAREIWGSVSTELHASLSATVDAGRQCEILESFLIDHLVPRPEEDALLEQVLTGIQNDLRIQDIQKGLGLSQRKLHELFDRRIGVRPKLFARILRLSASLSGFEERSSLAGLAQENGYSDQAHCSREFRQLAGTSPGAHKPIARQPNHGEFRTDKMFKTRKNTSA